MYALLLLDRSHQFEYTGPGITGNLKWKLHHDHDGLLLVVLTTDLLYLIETTFLCNYDIFYSFYLLA